MISESKIVSWLQESGFSLPRSRRFSRDETFSHIEFFPVALKVESSKVVHKSDVGGVITHLSSLDELERAKQKMISSLANHAISLESSDGFLCTEMIEGIELYAGVIDDDVFGKTILFGCGGVLLELYKDRCFIDSEASKEEIVRAIETTQISKIFHHFRGMNFSLDVIVSFIMKLQDFIKKHPLITEMDLNPLILNEKALFIVDARAKEEHTLTLRGQPKKRHTFFEHHNVAIVGVSSDPSKVGYAIAKNSLSSHIDVHFVNSKGGELFGKKLYTRIDEIDGDVDTIVVTIPAASLLLMLEEFKKKKVKNLIIISAGFKEVGDESGEQILKEFADKNGVNIIGPNCLGYYHANSGLNLTFGTSTVYEGSLALVSQSGAVLSALMDKAAQSGIGFSHLISLGNMADVDFAAIIEMLQSDDRCQRIGLYVEGIQEGKGLLNALRHTSKPVTLFKTGKSAVSKKAAFSHTGNLSGNYPLFTGLMHSVGVKVVSTLEGLIYTDVECKGDVLIVTNAGGPASVLTDMIIDAKKKMYELSHQDVRAFNDVLPFNWSHANPVDIIGDARSQRYEDSLKIADTIEGVSTIFLLITPQMMTDSEKIALLLCKNWNKKIIPIFLGAMMVDEAIRVCQKEKILYFTSLQDAITVL